MQLRMYPSSYKQREWPVLEMCSLFVLKLQWEKNLIINFFNCMFSEMYINKSDATGET